MQYEFMLKVNFVQTEYNFYLPFEIQEMRPKDPVSINEMMMKNYTFFGSAGVMQIMKKMEFGERFFHFFFSYKLCLNVETFVLG